MKEYVLTKEAAKLLNALYRSYQKARKMGEPRSEAVFLGGIEHIQKTVVPDWFISDVSDACWELAEEGLLECICGDNQIQTVALKQEAIVYMQSRFKRTCKTVVSAAKNLEKLIP